MRRCPSCHEFVSSGREICSACGYDFTDGRAGRGGGKGLSSRVLIPIAVFVGIAIAVTAVLTLSGRKRRPGPLQPVQPSAMQPAPRDSVQPGQVQRDDSSQAEGKPARLGRAASQSRDLSKKLDDLVVKTLRERKRLTEVNRLTQKNSDLLNQIQGRLNELRGPIANLPAAQTDEALRDAVRNVEERMAEVRRMFGGLER